jgi:hypothetical protein
MQVAKALLTKSKPDATECGPSPTTKLHSTANVTERGSMLQSAAMSQSSTLVVKAFGDEETLCRPYVDNGLFTGSFCEFECTAAGRIPSELWEIGQLTPHCTRCDHMFGACHFCRGISMATPPTWGQRLQPRN